jgi:hypothetical protein
MDQIKQHIVNLGDKLIWSVGCQVSYKHEWMYDMLQEVDTIIAPFLPDMYDVYYAKEYNDDVLVKFNLIEQKVTTFLETFQASDFDL